MPEALETMVERMRTAGGKVVSEIVTIPAARLFYALDLDGNSIAFFET